MLDKLAAVAAKVPADAIDACISAVQSGAIPGRNKVISLATPP